MLGVLVDLNEIPCSFPYIFNEETHEYNLNLMEKVHLSVNNPTYGEYFGKSATIIDISNDDGYLEIYLDIDNGENVWFVDELELYSNMNAFLSEGNYKESDCVV